MDLKRIVVCLSALILCPSASACVSVPKHADTASGEIVHQAGASRERCLDWLIRAQDPTPEHWLQVLDELAAEPKNIRRQSVARIAPYLEQWPDALRVVPKHWTPEDVARNTIVLPLIRHLDFLKLGRPWRDVALSHPMPHVTTLTLRNFAQTKHIHANPQLLTGVHDVRLRLPWRQGREVQTTHIVALLQGPWRTRITSLDTLNAQINLPVLKAIASLPLSFKHLRVSTRASKQDKAFLTRFEAWLKSPEFAHIQTLSIMVKPGLIAQTFVKTITSGHHLKRLRSLTFMSSRFTQDEWLALGAWAGWTSLRELKIISGQVTPALTQAMSTNPSLQGLHHLTLRNVGLTDEAISWLGHTTMLESLTHLNVSRNRLTTNGMWRLLGYKQLRALERLDVQYNKITSGIGARLAAAPHGATLKHINLDGNQLSIVDTQAMSKASWRLESLSLKRSGLSSAGTQALLSAPWFESMKHLNLSQNTLSAEGVRAMTTSKALLRTLDLSNTTLNDEGLKLLMRSDQVRLIERMNLADNAWTHAGTLALSKAKNMERLMFINLRHNNLGPPERIGEVANSPTMLHMHRALLSPKRIDLGEIKGIDVQRNEVSVSKDSMSMVSSMSHIPALGERVVKSAYISTALRRLLNESLIATQKDMAERTPENIPATVQFIIRRYVSRIDRINREMSPGQSFPKYIPRDKPKKPKPPAPAPRKPRKGAVLIQATPKAKVYDFKDSVPKKVSSSAPVDPR